MKNTIITFATQSNKKFRPNPNAGLLAQVREVLCIVDAIVDFVDFLERQEAQLVGFDIALCNLFRLFRATVLDGEFVKFKIRN